MTWPASSYPDVAAGTVTKTGYGSDDYDETVGSPIIWEHCDTGVPLVDQNDTWVESDFWNDYQTSDFTYKDHEARHAQAVIKLQTGGKAGWGGLWKIHGSATNVVPVRDPIPIQGITSPALPVPPQDITIDAKILDTNGNMYVALPDLGPPVDVTPYAAGVDRYIFDVVPTKALVSLSLNTSGTNLSSGDNLNFEPSITGGPPYNQLGSVAFNNPPNCVGFFNKVEIVGQVPFTPPANFGTFVFGQTNEEYGEITYNDGRPPYISNTNKIEALTHQQGNPSADGKIFAIDSPGIPWDSAINWAVLRQNFTTYVSIDGFRCANELEWHSLVIITNGTVTMDLGLGHIN